jgi:hypothetical protein
MGSGTMKSAGVWLLAFLANGFSANGQSTIDPSSRLDCWPQPSPSQSACEARQCIWDTNYYPQKPTTPLCYYPQSTGYIIKSQSGNTAQLTKSPQSLKNPYDDDIDPLTFTYKQIGAGSHITIGAAKRYVPPVKLNTDANIKSKEQLSVALFNGSTFSFKVQRQSTGESIWDTSIGGLLFGDKYIQIATYLPTDRIFGFGENIHQELKHDLTKYTTWGMFARDQPPDSLDVNVQNLYGVHPFYLGIEEDGKAHGVFIFNSNAQEVTTGPAPHLIYRTIGGQLDIFFFPGPSPEDVIRQYQQVIGTPFLPAYWAFGFQLCRYGYKDLQEMKDTVKRIQDANIPFDIPYADIDYMERFKDFTINQEGWTDFPEYAKQLHDEGLHLFLIFDPAIEADYDSFRRALEQKAKFIEWPSENLVPQSIQGKYPLAKNTTVMLGVVWPDKHVGFPDFLDPSNVTNQWWISEFVNFHQTLPFDGIWIDMNEPSNFGTNMGNNPGYPSGHPFVQPLACPLSGSDSSLTYRRIRLLVFTSGEEIVICRQKRFACWLKLWAERKYSTIRRISTDSRNPSPRLKRCMHPRRKEEPSYRGPLFLPPGISRDTGWATTLLDGPIFKLPLSERKSSTCSAFLTLERMCAASLVRQTKNFAFDGSNWDLSILSTEITIPWELHRKILLSGQA